MGFAVEKIPVRRSDVLYFFRRRHVGIKQVLLYHRRPLLVRLILVFFYNVVDYTVPSYMPSHLTAVLGYGPTKGLLIILIVMSIMIPIIVAMGRIGDRISGKRLVRTA